MDLWKKISTSLHTYSPQGVYTASTLTGARCQASGRHLHIFLSATSLLEPAAVFFRQGNPQIWCHCATGILPILGMEKRAFVVKGGGVLGFATGVFLESFRELLVLGVAVFSDLNYEFPIMWAQRSHIPLSSWKQVPVWLLTPSRLYVSIRTTLQQCKDQRGARSNISSC